MVSPDIDQVISQKTSAIPNTLTAPFDYLQSIPSNNNRIRGKFLAGFNERFLHISDDSVIAEISSLVEIFHGASLLIDDIEDDSTLRRGSPCAHIKYGVPATLNGGNLMYFVAIQRAFKSLPATYTTSGEDKSSALNAFRSRLTDIFVEEMVNLHVGQGYDIYWRDNFMEVAESGLPSIKEYLRVVMHKTGGLFRLAVRMLCLFAGASFTVNSPSYEKLIELANLLGIIYQIRDDYLNLVDERYAEMKGFSGEDLIEGKLSLPILYTLLQSDNSCALRKLYAELTSPRERRADLTRLEQAKESVAKAGALQYSYSLLQDYIEKARGLIGTTQGDSQTLLALLNKLAEVKKP